MSSSPAPPPEAGEEFDITALLKTLTSANIEGILEFTLPHAIGTEGEQHLFLTVAKHLGATSTNEITLEPCSTTINGKLLTCVSYHGTASGESLRMPQRWLPTSAR